MQSAENITVSFPTEKWFNNAALLHETAAPAGDLGTRPSVSAAGKGVRANRFTVECYGLLHPAFSFKNNTSEYLAYILEFCQI
jgi:hypothetical protein